MYIVELVEFLIVFFIVSGELDEKTDCSVFHTYPYRAAEDSELVLFTSFNPYKKKKH